MGTGKVYLVGAGPGHPKLITVRGLECIQEADVIIYDRLASPELLAYASPQAELIFCGKSPRQHTLRQERINQLLVEKAREGKVVTRLKGGDPSVFGRVGEEAEWLAAHAVPFEIVPGVTAAAGAAAAAGIPLTHRAYASSFAVVTGHAGEKGDFCAHSKETGTPEGRQDGAECERTWAALARGIDTLVFYMGMNRLSEICHALLHHGRAPDTPVAVIQWATTPRQKLVTGTLETIEQQVQDSRIGSPAVIVVGEVVRIRDRLAKSMEFHAAALAPLSGGGQHG
ncbi:uroporphyrin-III C-methyltransferase [Caldalkalibacillus thermarum]|uniref:uroporphyrinogen-III C-methyltransferase n=1 Tax=Caldalkalibacillus thermarum TaxID=296745 RepID=UPI00166EE0D8|nr:uroporphyrinogen-III C-methyltransferase [Caldalkalibacillus thermarum]GGK23409.1 uroporphyrin-III C-methyltransferase [Caldalkalibacillus thermarum]